MALTRAQRRRTGRPLHAYNNAIDRIRRAQRWEKRYKPTDTAHRHRLPDGQPKTEEVIAYTRRK